MTDYDLEDRIEKLNTMVYADALKLIYEWVKTDVINLRQFKEIMRRNVVDVNGDYCPVEKVIIENGKIVIICSASALEKRDI